MADTRIVLITGATGKQGGAVARHLAGKGFKIRAMTRKVDSGAARALAAAGAEVVSGDLNDAASLEAALTGAWGTFAVQNTWEAGVEGEEEQGKRFAMMARKVGIQHFVYSSVGSAHRQTGIPHFENKWRIEETIRGLGFPSRVIIRPVFFMENLTSPWFLNGDQLCAAMDPKTVLQMIAVDDIGKFGARAFTDASALNGREIDLAGDAVTIPQAATILGRSLGRTIKFVRVPIEEVRKNSEDFALMLEWFDLVGYNADIEGLEHEFGIKPAKLADWAERH
jgi:uncharacterized protein YbjT (DUF2867 family)